MDWYSPQAEARLGEAQEIIGPPHFVATVGFGSAFKLAFALPAILRARKNPDGKSLGEVLPPDLYGRWRVLKARYLATDDSVEDWRPQFAALALYDAALKSAGLEPGHRIDARLWKLADEHKLRKTSTAISFKVTDPRGVAKSFAKSNVDDVACFRSVLDQLDADVSDAADRANAWAVGDIAALARLSRSDDDSCLEAFLQVEAVREMGMQDAVARGEQKWLAAADAALAGNASTFAMLPVDQLLSGRGLLARLRAKGYAVEVPE
jgi:hypothetical protein